MPSGKAWVVTGGDVVMVLEGLEWFWVWSEVVGVECVEAFSRFEGVDALIDGADSGGGGGLAVRSGVKEGWSGWLG